MFKFNIFKLWLVLSPVIFANTLFGQDRKVEKCASLVINGSNKDFIENYYLLKKKGRYKRKVRKQESYKLADEFFNNMVIITDIHLKSLKSYNILGLQEVIDQFDYAVRNLNTNAKNCSQIKSNKQQKKVEKFRICFAIEKYTDSLNTLREEYSNELKNLKEDEKNKEKTAKTLTKLAGKKVLQERFVERTNNKFSEYIRKIKTEFPCAFILAHRMDTNGLSVNLLYPDTINNILFTDTSGFKLDTNKCAEGIKNSTVQGVGYDSKCYTKRKENQVANLLLKIVSYIDSQKVNNEPVFLLSDVILDCEGGADGRALNDKKYGGDFGTKIRSKYIEKRGFNLMPKIVEIDSGENITNEELAFLRAYNEYYGFLWHLNNPIYGINTKPKIETIFTVSIGPKEDNPQYRFCKMNIKFKGAFNYKILDDEKYLKELINTSLEERDIFEH